MTELIRILKVNEVDIRLECDLGLLYEAADKFSFFVPNHYFMPAFKSGVWDGKISLIDRRNGFSLYGLTNDIVAWAKEQGYNVELVGFTAKPQIDDDYIQMLIDSLKISPDKDGNPRAPRDYQFASIRLGLNEQKTVVVSPTASGKSLAIYCLAQFYKRLHKKVLVIVPNLSLIEQMYTDFADYASINSNINVPAETHKIFGGQDKMTDKPIVISTWQSLQNLPKSYFAAYSAVICDEVHGADAKQLTKIMGSMVNATHRVGFTGTLKDITTSLMTIKGLFGEPVQVETTKNLMDRGILAKLNVRVLVLTYPEEVAKDVRGLPYQAEVDFLIGCDRRNHFIKKLALAAKGNTMVLFRYVPKHGKPLFELIKNAAGPNREVFFVSGEVPAEDRETIRTLTETKTDAIIVASIKCFGTGINIVSLKNLILATPLKAKVSLLQSIGRALRKSKDKQTALLIDIVDNFPTKKGGTGKNYAVKHFDTRYTQYAREGFKTELVTIKL